MREGGYLREECRDPYAFVKATAHGMGSAKRKGAGIGKEQASGTLPRWSRMRHAVDPAPRRTIANAQPAAEQGEQNASEKGGRSTSGDEVDVLRPLH